MEKKLGILCAIVFVVGIGNIVFPAKEGSGNCQNSNIRTAHAYSEQDLKNFEQSQGFKVDVDGIEYYSLPRDAQPNSSESPVYINTNFLQTYEIPSMAYVFDPSQPRNFWLPFRSVEEIPTGFFILGPFVENQPGITYLSRSPLPWEWTKPEIEFHLGE